MKITKGKQNRARRVMLYGENGIGKSTFAASFPKPVVVNIEDGIGDIDVDHTEVVKTTSEFMNCLVELYDSEYKTIIVDTVDWLEKIIFAQVAEKSGKATIEEIGFGRGYQSVDREWRDYIKGFTALWNQGRHIVLVAHAKIAKFKDPLGDAYDYYTPALHDGGSGLLLEWCDEVLFAKTKTITIQKEEGFNNKRTIALGGDERVLVANKSAAQEAKNRLGMPNEIPLDFSVFEKYLHSEKVSLSTPSGNVAGLVKDGSSKVGV